MVPVTVARLDSVPIPADAVSLQAWLHFPSPASLASPVSIVLVLQVNASVLLLFSVVVVGVVACIFVVLVRMSLELEHHEHPQAFVSTFYDVLDRFVPMFVVYMDCAQVHEAMKMIDLALICMRESDQIVAEVELD